MEEQKKPEQIEKENSDSLSCSGGSQLQRFMENTAFVKKCALLAVCAFGLLGIIIFWISGIKASDSVPTEAAPLAMIPVPLTNWTSFSDMIVSEAAKTEKQYELYAVLKQNISEYNTAVANYNAVAEEYGKIKEMTSLENIAGLPKTNELKTYLDENIEFSDFLKNGISEKPTAQDTKQIVDEMNELLYALVLAQQITDPDEKWVIDRLKSIDGIIDIQAVTEDHDPNHLLNVDGGYTSCVYFSINEIQQNLVKSTSIIDKGTDAGGAVEVYKTAADAQSRCEYLGQFDNTLLYSGSYAILGTMVVRTSYLLTNEQQVELTDKITTAFTELK